jgi:hypothetical protein
MVGEPLPMTGARGGRRRKREPAIILNLRLGFL